MKQNNVIHVHLNEPYNGKSDFYFGSVAAIFEALPKDVVGAGKEWLWKALKDGHNEYRTRKATIRRGKVLTKHQNNKQP